MRDADGIPLYSVCQYEDIGDRKRAQLEVERLLALEREHDSSAFAGSTR